MNFVFDANCNPVIMRRVSALLSGHVFEDLRSTFPDADDETWIPAIGMRPEPWVVVSGDKARFERRAQAAVLKGSGLTWVALMGTFMNRSAEEQVRTLAEAWPRLVRKIERQAEPSIYKVKLDPNRRKREDHYRVLVEFYCSLRRL